METLLRDPRFYVVLSIALVIVATLVDKWSHSVRISTKVEFIVPWLNYYAAFGIRIKIRISDQKYELYIKEVDGHFDARKNEFVINPEDRTNIAKAVEALRVNLTLANDQDEYKFILAVLEKLERAIDVRIVTKERLELSMARARYIAIYGSPWYTSPSSPWNQWI